MGHVCVLGVECCNWGKTRRNPSLALVDISDGGVAFINRSLSQTKAGLEFKGTKTGRARQIMLPESAIKALAAHRAEQERFRQEYSPTYEANLDLIFANPDGTALRPDSVSGSISALCKRLKLPKGVSLHTLRHTHGSHLLAAGVPLPDVSKRLGHSNVHLTATVYAHSLPGADAEAVKKWEEYQLRENPTGKKCDPV